MCATRWERLEIAVLDAFLPITRGTICLLHEGEVDKLSLTPQQACLVWPEVYV